MIMSHQLAVCHASAYSIAEYVYTQIVAQVDCLGEL